MPEIDPMSKHGAEALAHRIQAYWAGKGVCVSPQIIKEPDATGRREYMYVVRSDIKFKAVR